MPEKKRIILVLERKVVVRGEHERLLVLVETVRDDENFW